MFYPFFILNYSANYLCIQVHQLQSIYIKKSNFYLKNCNTYRNILKYRNVSPYKIPPPPIHSLALYPFYSQTGSVFIPY